ncbi:site-specific recombinase XerD [Paraburkholderia graminis]|uniref:Site-specific recombinase XerD n=1 Tax=Paraburkholderia graminis TaxID=60548 RepID=A0ABD5CSH9_9BURK|nr:site-specific recombinase XerD [Paraburkholderia graminis]
MTYPTQVISPLRQRMMDDMRMRRLAQTTQANYLRVVREFTVFLGRSPDTATVEDLRRYQLYLVDRGVSPVSLNAAITGLKFFFGTTLAKEALMAKMRPVYLLARHTQPRRGGQADRGGDQPEASNGAGARLRNRITRQRGSCPEGR